MRCALISVEETRVFSIQATVSSVRPNIMVIHVKHCVQSTAMRVFVISKVVTVIEDAVANSMVTTVTNLVLTIVPLVSVSRMVYVPAYRDSMVVTVNTFVQKTALRRRVGSRMVNAQMDASPDILKQTVYKLVLVNAKITYVTGTLGFVMMGVILAIMVMPAIKTVLRTVLQICVTKTRDAVMLAVKIAFGEKTVRESVMTTVRTSVAR